MLFIRLIFILRGTLPWYLCTTKQLLNPLLFYHNTNWVVAIVTSTTNKKGNQIEVEKYPLETYSIVYRITYLTNYRATFNTLMGRSWYGNDDVIMGAIASQITSLTIVYSTVYWGSDQSKHQSSASLAFVRGIHRGPVNSPHKWPVTRKMFPFDDVIMKQTKLSVNWEALKFTWRHCSVKITGLRLAVEWQIMLSNTSPHMNFMSLSDVLFRL